ncbi:hypothetical protein IGI04_001624 [Brassica rapa subsp. trilocularis]|uniref:Uncharacterized protein n=1 Tax=Brassica rapa subsp. trilocularis TaxID=1813537 RepID=A0ABQ7NT62_BRACM|nr:hypothetical protein IGI04_001624 [Brassica rapa subsp. trilocularis]
MSFCYPSSPRKLAMTVAFLHQEQLFSLLESICRISTLLLSKLVLKPVMISSKNASGRNKASDFQDSDYVSITTEPFLFE